MDCTGREMSRFRVTAIATGAVEAQAGSGFYPLSLGSAASSLVSFNVANIDVFSGVTPGVVSASDAVVVDGSKDIGTFHTITMDGNLVIGATTLSETDLAKIDGITNGTAAASKALVLSAGGGIATITSATIITLTSTTVNATTAHGTTVTAGASGTAGTVNIFPGTGSKGKLAVTATDNAGDTITSLVIGAQAGARTYTLTDPVASTASINPSAIAAASADGAIAIKNGFVPITKSASPAVLTLAAPTATTHDGMRIMLVSTTAKAHTVTQASDGFNGGGGGADTATFGGAIGDGMTIVAYQGIWYVVSSVNVTLG